MLCSNGDSAGFGFGIGEGIVGTAIGVPAGTVVPGDVAGADCEYKKKGVFKKRVSLRKSES